MSVVLKHDIKIDIDVPQKDGTVRRIGLHELDSVADVPRLAAISRRVAVADTADLIFRMFVKEMQGDADLGKLSLRIPCLGPKYLPGLRQMFSQPDVVDMMQKYVAASDKLQQRAIRKQVVDTLGKYVEQTIKAKDLQFNFSKFKYVEKTSVVDKIKQGAHKVTATMMGLDPRDPFVMAAYMIWSDNVSKRDEEPRKAYWLLVRDDKGALVGMTFISAAQLDDKLINAKIIGHSGQILDPSVQGQGYVSAIKSVMTDFMYDNMDATVARESWFATTCDEFNENSQGLQVKSGAQLLRDTDGNVVIESGKMHWYASYNDILRSDLMQRAQEQNIEYSVKLSLGNINQYKKRVGHTQRYPQVNAHVQGVSYDR